MSLDLCLEADSTLTISTLSKAVSNAGAWEIEVAGNGLYAEFTSGLKLSTNDVLDDATIYAENTMGIDFPVAVRCTIRIRGPEPEGSRLWKIWIKSLSPYLSRVRLSFLLAFSSNKPCTGGMRQGCIVLEVGACASSFRHFRMVFFRTKTPLN